MLDNGFRAQIGDDDNGYEEPIICAYTWDELMTKLAEHVVAIYPNSTFAQRYRSRAPEGLGLAWQRAASYRGPS